MPESEAEWQELSNTLARKMLGWVTWNDLTIGEQERIKRGYGIRPTQNWRGALLFWWKRRGGAKPTKEVKRSWWYPHKSRSQAFSMLEAVAKKHHSYSIEGYSSGTYRIRICGWLRGWQGRHTSLPKAICIAMRDCSHA